MNVRESKSILDARINNLEREYILSTFSHSFFNFERKQTKLLDTNNIKEKTIVFKQCVYYTSPFVSISFGFKLVWWLLNIFVSSSPLSSLYFEFMKERNFYLTKFLHPTRRRNKWMGEIWGPGAWCENLIPCIQPQLACVW